MGGANAKPVAAAAKAADASGSVTSSPAAGAPSKFYAAHGQFHLDGDLTAEELDYAIQHYGVKGWLFANLDDSAVKPTVEKAGIKFAKVHIDPKNLTPALAANIISTLESLPRPTMIQCSTARRASAALALYLTQEGCSATQLAEKMGLGFLASAPLTSWAEAGAGEPLIFRQLYDNEYGSSTYSYLLADKKTKQAVLIDPVVELVERDLQFIGELGLTLTYAINTHCHADHITGTGAIKKQLPGVKSGIAKASGAKADIHYVHGDVIKCGSLELEVRATPGHTSGCLSFYTKAGGGMVFTGDALLIRGCGRTDFQQGDSRELYKSVHEQIFTLPDQTKVYPAHDYKGRTSSTVLEEKTHNPRLTKPVDEFVEIMENLNLPYPKKLDVSLPANLVCGFTD